MHLTINELMSGLERTLTRFRLDGDQTSYDYLGKLKSPPTALAKSEARERARPTYSEPLSPSELLSFSLCLLIYLFSHFRAQTDRLSAFVVEMCFSLHCLSRKLFPVLQFFNVAFILMK